MFYLKYNCFSTYSDNNIVKNDAIKHLKEIKPQIIYSFPPYSFDIVLLINCNDISNKYNNNFTFKSNSIFYICYKMLLICVKN